jgi:hypothetical protein
MRAATEGRRTVAPRSSFLTGPRTAFDETTQLVGTECGQGPYAELSGRAVRVGAQTGGLPWVHSGRKSSLRGLFGHVEVVYEPNQRGDDPAQSAR